MLYGSSKFGGILVVVDRGTMSTQTQDRETSQRISNKKHPQFLFYLPLLRHTTIEKY